MQRNRSAARNTSSRKSQLSHDLEQSDGTRAKSGGSAILTAKVFFYGKCLKRNSETIPNSVFTKARSALAPMETEEFENLGADNAVVYGYNRHLVWLGGKLRFMIVS